MRTRTHWRRALPVVWAWVLAALLTVLLGADPGGSAGSGAASAASSSGAASAERQALVLGHITQTADLVKEFGYATYVPELPHTDPSQFSYPVVIPGFPVFQHPVNLGMFQQSCGQCHRLAAPLPRQNDAPADVLSQLGVSAVSAPPPAGFTRLTDAPGSEGQPQWSPDGHSILYVADGGDGHWTLWTMHPDGTGKRQLTDAPEAGWASWSPRGDRILYWATDDRGRGNIWIMNADGTHQHLLTHEPMTAFPQWSPDASHVLYQARRDKRWDVWLTPLSGGQPTRISKPDENVLGNGQ